MGNVGKIDLNVLRSVKWSAKVEMFNIKTTKFGALSGEDAVEKEIEIFQGFRVGPCVPRVADVIDSNCDSGVIGVFFLWAHLTDNRGVCDILTSVL